MAGPDYWWSQTQMPTNTYWKRIDAAGPPTPVWPSHRTPRWLVVWIDWVLTSICKKDNMTNLAVFCISGNGSSGSGHTCQHRHHTSIMGDQGQFFPDGGGWPWPAVPSQGVWLNLCYSTMLPPCVLSSGSQHYKGNKHFTLREKKLWVLILDGLLLMAL